MSQINIKKPSAEQINTLRLYLNKALKEIEKIEKHDMAFNDELVQYIHDQELEDHIIELFAWLTTISSFQDKLFIKDDED